MNISKFRNNNRMKKLIVTAIAVFLMSTVTAQVNESTAKAVGQTFLNSKGSKSELKLAYSNSEYFIFNGETGFVIVSASNNVTPILGYSTEGNFDVTNLPPAVTEILQGYSKEIAYIISEQIEVKQVLVQWENLSNGIAPKVQKSSTVEPLIQTQWGQGDQTNYKWYNDSCPYDQTAGRNVLVGCNAVTMAQIMKYWNYPSTGTGERSYYHEYAYNGTTYNYGTLSVNFGSTTYNWSSMPNKLTASNPAVAQILYHCGVAINMKYSPNFSGAWGFIGSVDNLDEVGNPKIDVRTALQRYFGYAEGIYQIEKKDFTETEWISAIKTELDKRQPINYGSSSHSYICDGYDENDMFHLNFGWTGSCNGYFHTSSIIPTQGTWNQNHTNGQYAIMGIKPKNWTSIAETKNENNVKVYPNPTSGELKIKNEELREGTVIEIFNIVGQNVGAYPCGRPETTIDISHLANGMYYLRIWEKVVKFVKE